jgi:hypothetical protein
MDNALKEALQVVKTTAPQYFKDATDHTIRNRPLLKMLQQSGNLFFNAKAPKFVWVVEVREPKVRHLSGRGGTRTIFDQTDSYEQLEIDHAEMQVAESLTRRDQMINSNSPQQIVDIIGKKFDQMVKTMSNRISNQFYADNTSGVNTGMLTGIRSIIKPTGASSDQVAIPTSGTTYGGKSLELADLGGYWSTDLNTPPNATAATDWPFGSGSTEYDWNTPKMLNINASFNGDQGWENNCLKVFRRMNSVMRRCCGEGATPSVHLLGSDLLNEFKDKVESRERLYVSDYTKSLGFPHLMQYEDAIVMDDFDCPANAGYAINPSEMALYSVHDQLFFTDESWETPEQASLLLVGFLGNWVHKPKCTGAYVTL